MFSIQKPTFQAYSQPIYALEVAGTAFLHLCRIVRTIDLEHINYLRHPTNVEDLLSVDVNTHVFNFQRALSIDSINNKTKCLDRKAHMFWEIPAIDAKVNELMDGLSHIGDAATRLVMTGDSKDARIFFAVKQRKEENNVKLELSFVESLLRPMTT